jgi:hypothetical protein
MCTCVCFSMKTNYFEFNSLSLKPAISTALDVSRESPLPCQKGKMKSQRDASYSSFHLWAYCLWQSLHYSVILFLSPPSTKDKETLSLLPFCILADLTIIASYPLLFPSREHAHNCYLLYYMRVILGVSEVADAQSKCWQTVIHRSNSAHWLFSKVLLT